MAKNGLAILFRNSACRAAAAARLTMLRGACADHFSVIVRSDQGDIFELMTDEGFAST